MAMLKLQIWLLPGSSHLIRAAQQIHTGRYRCWDWSSRSWCCRRGWTSRSWFWFLGWGDVSSTPSPGLLPTLEMISSSLTRLRYQFEVSFLPLCFVEVVRNLDDEGWLLSLSNKEVMLLSKQIANELNSVNPWSWISSPTKRRISRVVGVEHCYTNAFLCRPTGQRHSTEKNTTAAKFVQKITPSKNWLLRLLDLKHRSMRSWKIIMLLNAFCISNSFRRKHLVFSGKFGSAVCVSLQHYVRIFKKKHTHDIG